MKTEKIIELLRVIAEDVAPVSRAKLAAAIVYRGRIISIGINQDKSHPFAAKYSRHPEAIYLHSETDAIYKASKKLNSLELKKSTLIVCRVKDDAVQGRMFGLAKPCVGCQSCIDQFEIKTVIYTTNSKKFAYMTELAYK